MFGLIKRKVIDHIHRLASKCNIQRPFFYHFKSSSNLENIVSNGDRMHHLASDLSHVYRQFQPRKHRFKQRQNAPYIVLDFKVLVTGLKIFSAAPKYHFKYRQNASLYPCFQTTCSVWSKKTEDGILLSILKYHFKYRPNASLRPCFQTTSSVWSKKTEEFCYLF